MPSRRTAAGALGLVLLAASCGRREQDRCEPALTGVWRAEATPEAPAGARWAILDRGTKVEIYPLFDDTTPPSTPQPAASPEPASPAAPALVLSPRSLELIHSHQSWIGHVERWVMRGAQHCQLRATARITGCHPRAGGAELDLELGELRLPDDLSQCLAPPAPPPQRQRWRRVD